MELTIIVAIIAFLAVTLLLVGLLLFAKAKLTSSGEVTIDINDGEKVITAESGSTLLSTLANNKVFLPSATSCPPRPVSSRARWPRSTGAWDARSR